MRSKGKGALGTFPVAPTRLVGDGFWGGNRVELDLEGEVENWRLSESHIHPGLAGG